MKGNILTQGVISAEDGNRYNYDEADFKDERKPQNGDEVDFVLEDGKATEIYITKQKFSNMSMINTSTEAGKVRMMAIIAIVLMIVGSIPVLVFLKLVGYILMFVAVYQFGSIAQSSTLFKNYLISGIVGGIGSMIVYFGGIAALASAGLSNDGFSSAAMGGGVVAFIGIAVMLAGLYWQFKAYKELSLLSENNFFLYAFYCYIAGALTMVIGIGVLIAVAGYILEVVAWSQLKDIKKASEIEGQL